MDEKVVNCFVGSALRVLRSELGMAVSMGRPSARADDYVTQEVNALLGVTGRVRGLVIFGLSENTTLAVVSRILGQPFERLDEMAQSGIAELGNVVVGASLTALAQMGYQCGVTPPAVVIGRDTVITTPNIRRIVIPLLTPSGSLEMQLALRTNGLHT